MQNINCGNIRFSNECLHELDGNRAIVSIPKTEIRSITVLFGRSSERPFLQIVAGSIFCILGLLIGVWPILGFIIEREPVREAVIVLKPFAFAAPLLIIGVYSIWQAIRKSHYLLVQTLTDERKLPIDGCSLSVIINTGKNFGYPISEG